MCSLRAALPPRGLWETPADVRPVPDAGRGAPGEDAFMQFSDRRDAGRRLAAQLAPLADEQPLVIALPRGGVPVGYEVAEALGAPLEILAVRKIGAPGNPEFGVGAIAEDGSAVLDPQMARRVGMTQQALDETVERETGELRRRVEMYRDGRTPIDVRGRTVIVVDDGLATGLTDLAAVRALRARGAARIVVAVPVGARESVALVGEEADEIICHTIPHELLGVGRWYGDFAPVSDAEVLALLAAASGRVPAPANGAEPTPRSRELRLDIGGVSLTADLTIPAEALGLVIFAHGSGSSRLSARNRAVATTLQSAGFATLLFDLLTDQEAQRRELRLRHSAARTAAGARHRLGRRRAGYTRPSDRLLWRIDGRGGRGARGGRGGRHGTSRRLARRSTGPGRRPA